MLSARWIFSALVILAFVMQIKVCLSDDGYSKTRELQQAVFEQRQQNQVLKERNLALNAEMLNLKHGREAAEERARTDRGMIGRKETFYQVIPSADSPNKE